MNCPECGHPADHHGYEGCMYPHKPDDIGDDYECLCDKTQKDIELAAWKAEAMAARFLLDAMAQRIKSISPDLILSSDEESVFKTYLATRVKDE